MAAPLAIFCIPTHFAGDTLSGATPPIKLELKTLLHVLSLSALTVIRMQMVVILREFSNFQWIGRYLLYDKDRAPLNMKEHSILIQVQVTLLSFLGCITTCTDCCSHSLSRDAFYHA